ncbi:MAG: 50S ribosomal protein L21 [Phycisphaerales bacterium]|jgi:large subunit ribosomal protein L21
MPYAIIEDSGTQIKVSPGDVLEIDLRPGTDGNRKGASLSFDRVLVVGELGEEKAAGGAKPARIGTPYIAGATVTAEVIEPFLGEKVVGNKYARRKGYRRKLGHRQAYLKVKIAAIAG